MVVRHLSAEELDRGASLCRRNAERYYKDAKILYERRSFGHSFMLGAFCIEELGKRFLLHSMKEGFIPQTELYLRAIFREHTYKTLYATMVLIGAPNLPPLISEITTKKQSLQLAMNLERLRQWSQYVDNPPAWTSPSDSFWKVMSKDMLLSLPIFLNIEPVPKREHLEHIKKMQADPTKLKELDELSPIVSPVFKKIYKKYGQFSRTK